MTTNVVITFEWDSSVSSFGWLLQRYRWDSPNQINTLFFLVIFLIDFPFLSGEEAFERSADCGFFCVCVSFIADFIHEQDRPFPRQDFTLWATPEVIPATV